MDQSKITFWWTLVRVVPSSTCEIVVQVVFLSRYPSSTQLGATRSLTRVSYEGCGAYGNVQKDRDWL